MRFLVDECMGPAVARWLRQQGHTVFSVYEQARGMDDKVGAQGVTVSQDSLTIDLVDGRTIIAPLLWYPRLWHGTPKERNNFEIIGDGTLIHWPDLDEDLSVVGILAGRRSGESRQSLKRWLEKRTEPL